MNVVILDTGCANLNSVKSAIGRHGYEPGGQPRSGSGIACR